MADAGGGSGPHSPPSLPPLYVFYQPSPPGGFQWSKRERKEVESLQILRVCPVNDLPGHQHKILFSAVFSSQHIIENLPTGQ